MWYAGCLFVLIVFLSACSVAGTAVCRFLPFKIRSHATAAYSPLIGLALFVLLSTLVAWVGIGFRTWICLPLSAAAVLAALWLCGDPGKALRVAAQSSAFAVLSSIGWFFPIIRYQAFNPYNDTFTYLVHAQWLQSHPFRESARVSGQYPALTQIATYQAHQARMGASFLFGWVQATFGVDWSYLVYPAVAVLPLIAGALAVAGTALFVVRKGRLVCWLGAAAAVTTLNGFSFGTMLGFLPQSYGIALGFGGLGLLGMCVYCLRHDGLLLTRALIPSAILMAALLFCYPEVTPLILIAALAYSLVEMLSDRALARAIAGLGLRLTLAVLLLANVEVFRSVRSLTVQAKAVGGGPVAWSPLQFLAHAAGFLSGAWDGSYWTFYYAPVTEIAVLLLLTGCCAVLIRYRRSIRLEAVAPAVAMLGLSVCAWLYFRYASASPWGVGTGQSWSQFKISNWVSLFILFLIICAVALASNGGSFRRFAVLGGLLLWQGSGLAWNYVLADYRTRGIRQETGFDRAPFSSYLQIRSAAPLAGNAPIYLAMGGPHHKSREMVTYFLADRPLASDWSDDAYLFPMLPEAERTYNIQPSMWIMSAGSTGPLRAMERRIGTVSLLPAPKIQPLAVTGGYTEEIEGNSNWRWTAHLLEYRYKAMGAGPLQLRARFIYLPASAGRQLRLEVREGAARMIETIAMQPGWTPSVSPNFKIHSADFSLIFECDQPPVRLSPADPRTVAFLIKDLRLETVE
jgi:hypothetical protein